MKVISTQNAPAAIGPYSQAIDLGNMVFVSGQIPVDPATGAMADTIEAQARQSLANLKAILAEAGLTMANVVKTVIFLADINDFAAVNAVYAEAFAEPVEEPDEPAADPEPAEPAEPAEGTTYVVVAGDSLWKIAQAHLGSGTRWGEIYAANRDIVSDPSLIYIGQVLDIPAR